MDERMAGLPSVLVSGYVASPAHTRWDPALEATLLSTLCRLPGVVGLEIPWIGGIHPHDPEWFLRHVPAGAQLAVTPLPFAMQRSTQDALYGIASADREGRAAAMTDLAQVARDVRRLQESPAAVVVVAVHTAPRGGGSRDALARSLDELAERDWAGAQLVIEHCDAVVPGQRYEKGFLALSDELAVLSQTPIGMWLNWGRSAIELRDADRVTEQVREAARSGRLVGLTFTGASSAASPYGGAWRDTHPPILETDPLARSILDAAHVDAALRAAPDVPWLGLKVSRRPSDVSAADVIATVARNLAVIRAPRADIRR